jgi:fucose permease
MAANSFAGWLSSLIFAFYVAVEGTLGLWAGTMLVVRRGFAPETAALCIAGFYGALTAGRIAVGFVTERWGNRRVINGGLLLAAAGLVGFMAAGNVPLVGLTLAAIGVGLAPVYPGLMHEVPRRFAPEAVQTVIGRQSGGAAFGAAVLPAVAGGVAQYSLGAVPWLVLMVLAVLIASIRRLNHIT